MIDKPNVSMLVFTYNQEQWVEEAVQSALDQEYENLEIIISDDCSSDSTYFRIRDAISRYTGPHRPVVLRNDQNLGIGLHVQKILSIASGELLVMCAGDDISMPNRVSGVVSAWLAFGKPCAVSSSLTVIDEKGFEIKHSRNDRYSFADDKLLNQDSLVGDHFNPETNIRFLGASLCYSTELLYLFGGFFKEINNEDIIMLGRAMLMGDVLQLRDCHVKHRITGLNVSAKVEHGLSTKLERPRRVSCMWKFLDERFLKIRDDAISRSSLYKQQLIDMERAVVEKTLSVDRGRSLISRVESKLRETEAFVGVMQRSIFTLFIMFLFGGIRIKVFKKVVGAKPSLLLLVYFIVFRWKL